MKKRLLCLFMGLILMLSVLLTACSSDDEEGQENNTGAQTITMCVITERKVCNTDAELAEYLEKECGGDKNSEKYKEMLKVIENYENVEEAFTKVTKESRINVDLLFYTEDEYEQKLTTTIADAAEYAQEAERAARALEKYISDYQAAYPEENYPVSALTNSFYRHFPEFEKYKDYIVQSAEEDEEESGNEKVEDVYQAGDLGVKELVYPETKENQLDIVYVSGLDMYTEYIENDWLIALDSYVSTSGKKLYDYISGSLLGGVQYYGSTYAIPNNVQIGEYKYMLVDKDLFDEWLYNNEQVNNILDLKNFLEDVSNSNPEVLPIDATFEECISQFVWYWNIDWTEDIFGDNVYSIGDGSEFSLLGALYGDPATASRGQISLGFNSLFTSPEYRDIYLKLKAYEFNGYYATENDTRTDAAVSFVDGDYTIKASMEKNDGVYKDENGKEYYAYVVKYPEVDEQSLYGNMFGVFANSSNISACVKVLTMLNTDAKLRNILQYGVEGVDYTINEDTGVLTRSAETLYKMDIEKTGNCFIAHPEEGLPADYWENAKNQNNDALINPLLGFDFNSIFQEYDTDLDYNLWSYLMQYTAQISAEIEACEDIEQLTKLVSDEKSGLCVTLASDPLITVEYEGQIYNDFPLQLSKLTNKMHDTSEDEKYVGESPYAVYYTWMQSYGYVPAGE
ncbi:MAG: hypothetical protein E7592_03365 [Ruminococcaceae bacterium]|nr:hypothetical protein [Oscillospiraceae bacterium]